MSGAGCDLLNSTMWFHRISARSDADLSRFLNVTYVIGLLDTRQFWVFGVVLVLTRRKMRLIYVHLRHSDVLRGLNS